MTKKRKVEAWAVVLRDKQSQINPVVYVDAEWSLAGQEENAFRHANPGSEFELVKLVPLGTLKTQLREAMKVVRAAQRAVNREQMGPCNCNERQCRLRQAVSRFEKQRTKRAKR